MNNKVKIRITTRNQNYLIKDLLQRNIELFWINQTKDKLECIVKKEDYETIQKMKTIKSVEIIEYYGFNRGIHFIKKYSYLIILIIGGILINVLLSKIILQIKIETPNKVLEKNIKKDLKELGLKEYHWKVSYEEKNKIKEKLLEKEKNHIEWLEIEEKGTKYIVKVEEKKLKQKETCPMRNIAAKKKAVLTRIEASSGEIMKKKQDYVEKGEVVISGLIYNKETIVSKKCAVGKIYGETWYKVTIEIPQTIKEEKKTKNHTWGISFHLLNKEKYFGPTYKTFQKNEYNILKSKISPFRISITKKEETREKEEKYTLKNCDAKGIKEAEEKLKEYFQMKPIVLQKKVLKKTIKNSKIIVEVFFAIEEDITDYQDITNLDIEKMNQEKEE